MQRYGISEQFTRIMFATLRVKDTEVGRWLASRAGRNY
jgi:hypothetical protein